MDLSIFEGKALQAALSRAGHDVGVRTAQRWIAGTTPPKPQDLAAIRKLLGLAEHEEAPRPAWAEGLIEEVSAIRGVVEANAVELETLRVVLEAIEEGLLRSGDDPAGDPARLQSGRRRDQ